MRKLLFVMALIAAIMAISPPAVQATVSLDIGIASNAAVIDAAALAVQANSTFLAPAAVSLNDENGITEATINSTQAALTTSGQLATAASQKTALKNDDATAYTATTPSTVTAFSTNRPGDATEPTLKCPTVTTSANLGTSAGGYTQIIRV